MQCRENDNYVIELIEKINHKETSICASVERSLLKFIGGDCDTAVGGYAKINEGNITLKAELFSDDYQKVFKCSETISIQNSQILGEKVGKELLRQAGENYKKKF